MNAAVFPKHRALPYDVLLCVFSFFRDEVDYETLRRCSLVNWQSNSVASALLYSTVVYSPTASQRSFNDSHDIDEGELREGTLLKSASLPKNAPFVQRLEVSGYLSERPPPQNTFARTICRMIRRFTNLHTLNLTPNLYNSAPNLFTDVIPLLSTRTRTNTAPSLVDLTVNNACATEFRAMALLSQITGLQKLTILQPNEAYFSLLASWLGALKGTLTEFNLVTYSESITADALMALAPHLSDQLRSFCLGLSTSLAHEDILKFLSYLPHLKTAVLSYHSQALAIKIPPLPKLRNFTVRVCPNIRYSSITTRQDVNQFCKWVRFFIASSPSLETVSFQLLNNSLRLSTAFHSIVDHLVAKHADTLRVMDLSQCFVGADRLREICRSCSKLEVLAIAGRRKCLDVLKECCGQLTNLQCMTLNVLMVHPSNRVPVLLPEAENIFRQAPSTFKRLTVDSRTFEATWVCDPSTPQLPSTDQHAVTRIVREISVPLAPWEKSEKPHA